METIIEKEVKETGTIGQPDLLSNKVIQLDDESANNMAIKLAFYYYRLSAA
jgi:hypothetical protein